MNLQSLFVSSLLIAVAPTFYTTSCFGYEVPTDVSQKLKPATIKVLLLENAPDLILEAKGKYQLCNPSNGFVLGKGSFSKTAKLSHDAAGMKWGEVIPAVFQLRIVPLNSETTILVNGMQYRGCVDIYDNNGKFVVVNEVDVESYLRSILSSEIKENLHHEVLNALVVTARTNVYNMLNKKNAHSFYHVKASDVSYRGHGSTLINTQLEEAISETRHAIMTYQGSAFPALWAENSAGKTSDYASIFRKNASSPQGVDIPITTNERQKMGWSFSVTRDQLAHIVDLSKITKISLFAEKKSGKVYAVKISDGEISQDIDYFTLQTSLGESKLKSNDFTIDVKGDTVTFKGYGKGHGTGLCLHSASLMANQGVDAAKILSTFFPNTKIEKLRSASTERSITR